MGVPFDRAAAHGRGGVGGDGVDCDFYDFLRHVPCAVNSYRGEYMTQYSWAEITTASLVTQK